MTRRRCSWRLTPVGVFLLWETEEDRRFAAGPSQGLYHMTNKSSKGHDRTGKYILYVVVTALLLELHFIVCGDGEQGLGVNHDLFVDP